MKMHLYNEDYDYWDDSKWHQMMSERKQDPPNLAFVLQFGRFKAAVYHS